MFSDYSVLTMSKLLPIVDAGSFSEAFGLIAAVSK